MKVEYVIGIAFVVATHLIIFWRPVTVRGKLWQALQEESFLVAPDEFSTDRIFHNSRWWIRWIGNSATTRILVSKREAASEPLAEFVYQDGKSVSGHIVEDNIYHNLRQRL